MSPHCLLVKSVFLYEEGNAVCVCWVYTWWSVAQEKILNGYGSAVVVGNLSSLSGPSCNDVHRSPWDFSVWGTLIAACSGCTAHIQVLEILRRSLGGRDRMGLWRSYIAHTLHVSGHRCSHGRIYFSSISSIWHIYTTHLPSNSPPYIYSVCCSPYIETHCTDLCAELHT